MPEYLRDHDEAAGLRHDEETRIAWQADRSEFYRRRQEMAIFRKLGPNHSHLDRRPQIYPRRWDWEFIAATSYRSGEISRPMSNQAIRIYNDTWMPNFIGPHEYVHMQYHDVYLRQETHERILETTEEAEVLAWCLTVLPGTYSRRTLAQEEADIPSRWNAEQRRI